MFKSLRQKLGLIRSELKENVEKTPMGYKLKEGKVDDILWSLELILLESDVALTVIEAIKADVKAKLQHQKLSNLDALVENVLREAITDVLRSTFDFDAFIDVCERPAILMFVGVNGSGKTTAIARIAYRLQQQNLVPVIAAADTFRAGAIEQLEKHSEALGIKLIKHKAGSDPAAVAYDAIQHSKAKNRDVVLIDTAGRMQTNVNLMDEMKKIKRVAEPHLTIFVGDALAGNDAVEQAMAFNEVVGIDGTILTKIDADAKGGAALSIAYVTGRPIMFIGTGQGYGDLTRFDQLEMVDRLF